MERTMPDDRSDEFESDDDTDDERPSLLRKQANEARAEAKALKAEVEALRRESAFREAGIDPGDPRARYFVKGYDGELTAEAIKAEAESAGILGEPQSTIPADEVRAQQEASALTAGADAPNVNANKEAEYLAAIQSASSPEEVLRIAAEAGVRIKNPLDE